MLEDFRPGCSVGGEGFVARVRYSRCVPHYAIWKPKTCLHCNAARAVCGRTEVMSGGDRFVPTGARPVASATGTSQAHRRNARATSVAPHKLCSVAPAHRLDAVIASESIGFIAGGSGDVRCGPPTRFRREPDFVSTFPAHDAVGLGRHLPRGGDPNCAALRISPKSNSWCAPTLSLARARGYPRRRPTANGETIHENQVNPEQRQFRRPWGHGPFHSRSRGRGRQRRRTHRRDAAKAKRLAAALGGGATAGTFGTARPATWSSCRAVQGTRDAPELRVLK